MRQANIIEASAFKSCVDQKSYHKILLNTMHIIEDGIQDAHTRRLSNVMQAMLGGLADVDNAAWTTSTDGTSDLRRTIGIEGRLEILNWRFEKRKWAVFQKKARAGADGEDLALPDINLEDLDDEMLAFFDDDAATDLTMADVGKDGVVEAPQLASTVVSKATAAPIRL